MVDVLLLACLASALGSIVWWLFLVVALGVVISGFNFGIVAYGATSGPYSWGGYFWFPFLGWLLGGYFWFRHLGGMAGGYFWF